MRTHAEGLPKADAVVLMLELVDRGMSVTLKPEEGKETYMVAGIDLGPKPTPDPHNWADEAAREWLDQTGLRPAIDELLTR